MYFVEDASRTSCDLLFNRAWLLRHWYQKPAHFEEAELYPQWHSFLKSVTPDSERYTWQPVQYYNTYWKPRRIEHSKVCFLLDSGESVALGSFDQQNGKTYRRANLQVAATGIVLDIDEGIPRYIHNCEDLIKAVPFLRYATGLRESLSSRSARKGGVSQFRAYFGLRTPIPVDCGNNAVAVRGRELLGEWLAKQAVYAPEGLAKNAVCVAYGNAGTQSKYDSDYLVADGFVQELIQEAEYEITAEKQAKSEKKAKQERYKIKNTRSRDSKQGDTRYPIVAFIEDEEAISYMARNGWITHLRGDEYHWHESGTAGRSCLIENGIIKPFSATMQGASPKSAKPVNAHRFIIFYETGLDITKESEHPEICKQLADRGYGMSLSEFKRQKHPIPPLDEVLRAQTEVIKRSIENAPEPERRYTHEQPKLNHLRTQELPTESLDENEKAREKAVSGALEIDTEKTQIWLFSDVTGSGKSHTVFTNAKKLGKRPIGVMPHTDLAQQAVSIARNVGFFNPRHIKGRDVNWDASGIEKIPVELRDESLFERNHCIMCDKVKEYTDRRIPARTYCEHKCDFRGVCIKDYHLSQYQGLEDIDCILTCMPNLCFNPEALGFLKMLITGGRKKPTETDDVLSEALGLEPDEETIFDMVTIDDYTVAGLYNTCSVSLRDIQALRKAWQGYASGELAENIAHAFLETEKHKIYEKLVDAVADISDDELVNSQLSQHARHGVIEKAPKIFLNADRNLLSHYIIRFEDKGVLYIPKDEAAYEALRLKNVPVVNLEKLPENYQVGDAVVIPTAVVRALMSNIPIDKLSPIWQSNWTLLDQIKTLVNAVGTPENAPVEIVDGELTFEVPPQDPKLIDHILMLSPHDNTTAVNRAFQGQDVEINSHAGQPIDFADDVKVFQFSEHRITASSVFVYPTADGKRQLQNEPTALTPKTVSRFQKFNDWAKSTDGVTCFISYREIVEVFRDTLDAFDVVMHFDRIAGLNLDGLKLLVVYGYPKVKNQVVISQALTQYAGDIEPIPDGSYDEITETAEYTENGITITETRYIDTRLEAIRHQLATEKLKQAVGRARHVRWEGTTTIIFTDAPIPTITERAELFREQAFYIANDPRGIKDATQRIKQAEQKGDAKAYQETTGVSQMTAYRKTKDGRKRAKQDRDAEICKRYAKGETQQAIAESLDINKSTVSRVLKKQIF